MSANIKSSLSDLNESKVSCQNPIMNTMDHQSYLAKEDRDLSKQSDAKQIDPNQKSSSNLVQSNTNLDQNESFIDSTDNEDSISLELNEKHNQFTRDRRPTFHKRKSQKDLKKLDSLYKHVLTKSLDWKLHDEEIDPNLNRSKKVNSVIIEKEKSQFSEENFGMELLSFGEYEEEMLKLKVKRKNRKPKRHIKNSLTTEPQNNSLDSNHKSSDYLPKIQLCNFKKIDSNSKVVNGSKKIMIKQILNGNFIEESYLENDKDMLEKDGKAITLNTDDSISKNAIDFSNGVNKKINDIKSVLKKCCFLSPEAKKSATVHFIDQNHLQKSNMTNDNYSPPAKLVRGNFTKLHNLRIAQLENSDKSKRDDQSRDNIPSEEKNIDEFQIITSKNKLKKYSCKKLGLLVRQANQTSKKLYYSPLIKKSVPTNQKEDSEFHSFTSAKSQLNTSSHLISENKKYDNFEMKNFSNQKHGFNINKLKNLEDCKEMIFRGQSSNQQINLTYESLAKNTNLKMKRRNC